MKKDRLFAQFFDHVSMEIESAARRKWLEHIGCDFVCSDEGVFKEAVKEWFEKLTEQEVEE